MPFLKTKHLVSVGKSVCEMCIELTRKYFLWELNRLGHKKGKIFNIYDMFNK